MESNDWSLLPEDELVNRAQDSAGSGASPGELRRAAINQYTLALYEACRQTEDPTRRERAYGELFRYLFRAAYNRWPDLAADVTQRALLLVHEQIERCRKPGAFLAFALFKLRHAFDLEKRLQRDARLFSLADVPEPKTGSGSLHRGWQIRALVEAIQRLPDERQRQAILLRFFAGLNDEEIAARLEITPGHVRVLRHRGMVQLRQDRRLAGDFDLPNGGNDEEGTDGCNAKGRGAS